MLCSFSLVALPCVVNAEGMHEGFNSSDLKSIRAVSRNVLVARSKYKDKIYRELSESRADMAEIKRMMVGELGAIRNSALVENKKLHVTGKAKGAKFEKPSDIAEESVRRSAFRENVEATLQRSKSKWRGKNSRNKLSEKSIFRPRDERVLVRLERDLQSLDELQGLERQERLEVMLKRWEKPELKVDPDSETPTIIVRTKHVAK